MLTEVNRKTGLTSLISQNTPFLEIIHLRVKMFYVKNREN